MKTNVLRQQIVLKTGTYTGNDTEDRAIPHGLGRIPAMVMINLSTGTTTYSISKDSPTILRKIAGSNVTVTAMDSNNFYVGDISSYPNSANGNAAAYDWMAIG